MWHCRHHRKQTNSHWRRGYIGHCSSGWTDSFYWDRCADLGQVHSVLFWEKWACIAATWSQQSLRNYKGFFEDPTYWKVPCKIHATLCGSPQTHPVFLMDLSFCSQISSRIQIYFFCMDFTHEGEWLPSAAALSPLPQWIPGYVHILIWCIMSALTVHWSEIVLSTILWM